MDEESIKTGIDIIGSVPWGTHFCQFYQTKEDLLDTLVPYFKAGLENNEFCMWITAEPLTAPEARKAMSRAMPDFAERLAKGQIEILPHTKWYLKGGKFDQQRVLNGWVDKLNAALARGYAGLRLTGNTFWLEKRDWNSFTDYEAAVNEVIGQYRMLALCTYSLDKCGAIEIMDVVRNHEFALVREEGKWELIESTVHKQTKQALGNSERKYRQLVESMQEGIWVLDKDVRTTFVNPHMAAMLGYTAEEMLGKPLFSFVDESRQALARERMERRRQGIGEQVEFEFRRKDGSPLLALVSAAPLTDRMGTFSGVIAGIVDITERKRTEEDLRSSEERYRGLYQSVAGGIIVQDKNGIITEANALAREILGLTLDEITGRTSANPEWQAIREDGSQFPGEEHPAMIALRTGESVRGVLMGVFNPTRREHRWILINAEPLKDPRTGEVHSVATTFVDVTERRSIGEELRRSRGLMEAVTQGTGVIMATQDTNYHYTYFNQAYREEIKRLTGKDLQLGDSMIDLFADMPDQQKVAVEEWSRMLKGETATQRIEFGQPGRYRAVYRVFHTPIRDQNGNVAGAGEVAFDVTQQVLAEKALREADRRTHLLADTASELLKTDSPQLLVNSLCTKVMDHLGCHAFFNFLVDESAGRLRLNAYAGISEEQAREIEWLDYGAAICGCAARDACRLVAENILETPDPRTELVKSYGIQAYACHPLIAQDHVLGTLSFGTRTRARFTDEELSVMKAVADLVAIAMQRKQTEDTLRETSSYLDNLLNYANAPIIVWDPELCITKFNRAFQRLTGYSEAEALGHHLAMLFPEETRGTSLSHIARAATGERWETVEIPILRVDGEVRTVLWNSANIFASDGQTTVATIAQGQDITDRKQAEELLRDAMLRYRTVADNTYNFEFWINPGGQFLYASPSSQRVYGRAPAEFLADPGLRRRIIHPDDLAAFDRHVSEEARQVQGEVEYRIVRSDGTHRWLAHVCQPVFDEGGRYLGIRGSNRDITERRQTQDALRETRDYLNNLLNYANAPIIVWNPELRVTRFNRAFQRLTGYGEAEVLGQHLSMLFSEQTREESLLHIRRTATGERWETVEIPILRADGEVRTVLWNSATIYATDGTTPMATIAQGQDITERKQVEEALRESEKRLNRAQEIGHLGGWELDLLSNRLTWSDEVYRIFGLQPQEFSATYEAFLEAVHPDDRAAVDDAYSGSIREGRDTYDIEHRIVKRSNGQVRIVHERCQHVRDSTGRIVRSVGMVHDITERKFIEESLRESEERHRLVFEAAMDGFWVNDLSGRLLQVNDSYCQMSGYTRQELLKMRIPDVEAVEKPEETAEHMRKVFQQGQDRFETRHRRRDGSLVDIEVSVRYLDVRGGQFVVSARDITERKKAEEAIVSLNDALRRRAAELEAANKELEAFAYSVSHDLRAPLRSIDGFSLALLEDYAGKLDDEGKDYLHRVRAASQTMGELIDDMLDLSRVTRAEIHWKRVDLSSLAHRIAQALQAGEPKRRVEFVIAPDLSVYGDAPLLRAALENLLGNAWKFTGRRDRAKIEFGARKENGQQVYFVKDNGVGFDMNHAGKLFEPFHRLHSKSEFAGTGIGLATVRRIIGRHGGRIWAEAKLGSGASFYFTFGDHTERKRE